MLLFIRRIFALLIRPVNIRLGVFPTSANAVAAAAITLTSAAAAWTWGTWTTLALATVVTVDTTIIGLTLENFVGAVSQGEVAIAIGPIGSEVEIARKPVTSHYYEFLSGLFCPVGTRISAAYRTSTGVADTVDIKLLVSTGA